MRLIEAKLLTCGEEIRGLLNLAQGCMLVAMGGVLCRVRFMSDQLPVENTEGTHYLEFINNDFIVHQDVSL